jgi:hypothetical protein
LPAPILQLTTANRPDKTASARNQADEISGAEAPEKGGR